MLDSTIQSKENERQLITKRPRRQCTLPPAPADPEVLGKVSAFVRFTGVECLFWGFDQVVGKRKSPFAENLFNCLSEYLFKFRNLRVMVFSRGKNHWVYLFSIVLCLALFSYLFCLVI